MSEPNQVLWRGIRPIDPPEFIPVLPYKPGLTQYRVYGNANGNAVTLLTVPSGHTYHIINITGSARPAADGSGTIALYDDSDTYVLTLGYYFADTYRLESSTIALLTPIEVLENESIKIRSWADNFYIYGSIIYTKE